MSKKFRAYETGIRISTPGLAADPVPGKKGMIYQNTTRNVLRYCVAEGPDVWIDLFVQAGTIDDSTIRWDAADGRWKENETFRINGSTLYSADAATQNDIYLQGGDTTNLSLRGSDVYIQPGEGDAGTGYLFVDTSLVKPSELSSGAGRSIAYEAGDTTDVAERGGDLSLSAGTGPLGLGNLSLSGYTGLLTILENLTANITGETNINSTGDLFISAPKIGLGASGAVDPTGDLLGDIYYNTEYSRWRQYNGTDWYWWDVNKYNIPTYSIDLYDPVIAVLPADTTTDFVDGEAVVDGMTVLMPIITNNPQQATVIGTAITWTNTKLGVNLDGTLASGDSIRILDGTYADSALIYNASLNLWESPYLPSSASVDNILRHNGSMWVVESFLNINDNGKIYLANNSDIDAIQPDPLTLSGAGKFGGTGDGGDVNLIGGSSIGGERGSVVIDAAKLLISSRDVLSTPELGALMTYEDITTNTKLPLISSGLDWQRVDSADINGEITGFVNLVDSTINWDDLTRTVTLTVPGTAQYFIQGQRVELSADADLIIPDISQANYITINRLGELSASTTFDPYGDVSASALVAIVQWNANDQIAHSVIDARTLVTIDWANREYIRKADGILATGMEITLAGTAFDGTSATDYQFSIAAGDLGLPDRTYAQASVDVAASEIPVISNEVDAITVAAATTLPLTYNTAPKWNELSGTWQETSVTDGYYFTQWVVSSRDGSTYSLMGQAEHQTLQGAVGVKWDSIQTANFDKAELVPLYKVIFRYSTAYTNAAESVIVEVERLFNLDAAKVLISQQLSANEYRNTKVSGGGTIVFTPATNTLAWDADAFLNIPGVIQSRNTISASSVVLAADNSVAYVVINRTEGAADTLTVSTSTFAALPKLTGDADDIYVIAHRIDGKVYLGDTQALYEITLTDNTTDAELLTLIGADKAAKLTYSVVRNTDVESGDIHAVGIGTTAAISNNATSSGALGVDFGAEIDTGNLKITYTTTSTGVSATMRYSIDSWNH